MNMDRLTASRADMLIALWHPTLDMKLVFVEHGLDQIRTTGGFLAKLAVAVDDIVGRPFDRERNHSTKTAPVLHVGPILTLRVSNTKTVFCQQSSHSAGITYLR